MSLYLRPTAFVDAPFGFGGQVARLAGGLLWFSAVEWIDVAGGVRRTELVPVSDLAARLERSPQARATWDRLTAPRAALTLGERVVRLDQPQVVGILNITPDSFSDGGRHEDAAAAFREAAAIQDRLPYMEPPFWYYPARQSLGGALLAAGRPAEAAQAFRESLARTPNDAYALFGLVAAQKAQGDAAGAAVAEDRFRAAWSGEGLPDLAAL